MPIPNRYYNSLFKLTCLNILMIITSHALKFYSSAVENVPYVYKDITMLGSYLNGMVIRILIWI